MATDIARRSFDPGRHYTGVVSQQGRVALEAEENEDREIRAEARRRELLDIVGPAGVPANAGNSYAISQGQAGPLDFTVSAGTIYVGGLRVELDADVTYGSQPDWLDHLDDPDWVPVPTKLSDVPEGVTLVLIEREVTAVEDPMLKEVALGGPDGAARRRILQHIERRGAFTCDDLLALQQKWWAAQGLQLDPSTMELRSQARLQVQLEAAQVPSDPCQPQSQGGYLGADNQVIRVEVVNVQTPPVNSASGPEVGQLTFDLLWGWDNASFLYAVSATPPGVDPTVLTLAASPVDDSHRPRVGQVVEVLRSAARLATDGNLAEGYVASHRGQLVTLDAAYDSDTKSVQLPAKFQLPPAYLDQDQTPQLYLRVWEGLVSSNAIGAWVSLPGTGLQVQVTTIDSTLHDGDFWSISVRPLTPTVVYPDRLLHAPQPPDGLRMWACPLGIVAWEGRDFQGQIGRVVDCRKLFDPLTACCIPSTPGLGNIVGIAGTPEGRGYWLVDSQGQIFTFGDAVSLAPSGGVGATGSIVGIAANPTASQDGQGYWLVASDGQVFAYGSAEDDGGTLGHGNPMVGMAGMPHGPNTPPGYWLVDSAGVVFALGNAGSHGDASGQGKAIVGMAAVHSKGYWLVASDGTVFAFGWSHFGDASGQGKAIVGMAGVGDAKGYWLVASDGTVFPFGGSATHFGDASGQGKATVGMAATPEGLGYWLVASDGTVFAFGDAPSLGSLQAPTRSMASAPALEGSARAPDGTGRVLIPPALMHGGSIDPGGSQPPRQELLNGSYPGWHISDSSQVLTFSLGRPATVGPDTVLELTLYWTTTNQQQLSWVVNWRWVQALQTLQSLGQPTSGADLGPLVAAVPSQQSVQAPASSVGQLMKTKPYSLGSPATPMPVGDYLVVQVNAEGFVAGTDPGVYVLLAEIDW